MVKRSKKSKFESCVLQVKKKSKGVNPFAVCRKSVKFKGSTKPKKKNTKKRTTPLDLVNRYFS